MKFDLLQPATIPELKKLLNKKKKNTFIFAGGTDLLVKMRHKTVLPQYLVDIKKIKNLSKIEKNKTATSIGATVTLNEIAESNIIKKHYPALALGAQSVGSYQIRNRATIAGNICNASPAADTIPALLIYNAKVKIISLAKTKTVSIHEFFKGPGKTILKKNECVESILLPYPGEVHSTFLKFSRRKAVDLSTVCIATGIFNKNKLTPKVRIAVGACAPVTSRAAKAEKYLMEHGLSETSIEKAASLIHLNPISDLRGSKHFREKIAKKLFTKAMAELKVASRKDGGMK